MNGAMREGVQLVPRVKPYLPLCHLSPNLITHHHKVLNLPLIGVGRLCRSVSPTDELQPFTKGSLSGLGYTTAMTALLSGIRVK